MSPFCVPYTGGLRKSSGAFQKRPVEWQFSVKISSRDKLETYFGNIDVHRLIRHSQRNVVDHEDRNLWFGASNAMWWHNSMTSDSREQPMLMHECRSCPVRWTRSINECWLATFSCLTLIRSLIKEAMKRLSNFMSSFSIISYREPLAQ